MHPRSSLHQSRTIVRTLTLLALLLATVSSVLAATDRESSSDHGAQPAQAGAFKVYLPLRVKGDGGALPA